MTCQNSMFNVVNVEAIFDGFFVCVFAQIIQPVADKRLDLFDSHPTLQGL